MWSESVIKEEDTPTPVITVPIALPGGFGQIVFDHFGVMHTPNENSYLLYAERKSEATH